VALLFIFEAVYKWVDKEDKVHYSDKHPRAVRPNALAVSPTERTDATQSPTLHRTRWIVADRPMGTTSRARLADSLSLEAKMTSTTMEHDQVKTANVLPGPDSPGRHPGLHKEIAKLIDPAAEEAYWRELNPALLRATVTQLRSRTRPGPRG